MKYVYELMAPGQPLFESEAEAEKARKALRGSMGYPHRIVRRRLYRQAGEYRSDDE